VELLELVLLANVRATVLAGQAKSLKDLIYPLTTKSMLYRNFGQGLALFVGQLHGCLTLWITLAGRTHAAKIDFLSSNVNRVAICRLSRL
jgi:hypothetical protein